MHVELFVVDELAEALQLDGRSVEAQIGLDVAISCYERGLISVGKASEASGLKRGEFEMELSRRKVVRPYAAEESEADSKWASEFVPQSLRAG